MKSPVILFVVLLMSLALHGQVTIGFSGGVNFSSAKFKDNHRSIQEGYIGMHAGMSGKYQNTDVAYFSLEGQFTEKGYNPDGKSRFSGFNQPFPFGFKETVYKSQYIDIMPEIELRLIDWLSVGLGAQYGYYLEGLRKSEGGDWVKDVTSDKVNDVGLIAALQIPTAEGGGPTSSPTAGYHWGPSVSWNTYLNCWVTLLAKATGPS